MSEIQFLEGIDRDESAQQEERVMNRTDKNKIVKTSMALNINEQPMNRYKLNVFSYGLMEDERGKDSNI